MLEERLAVKEPPLRTIPNEHKPVFAKLVHERCVTTLAHDLNIYAALQRQNTTSVVEAHST